MSDGLSTRPTALTFEVDRLMKLAWSGQIRVPHFQRGFRWGQEDVKRLFDSIVKGYPVGNLLFWVRSAPRGEVKLGTLHFPVEAMNQALWVVDGQQRIVSLANALHPQGQTDTRFALSYDLERRQFIQTPTEENPLIVPLPTLFDLRGILSWFAKYPEVVEYVEYANEINQSLRQFQVPAYQVSDADVTVLQDIFSRVNSYGKRLSRAEIFSGLTATDEDTQNEGIASLTIDLIAERVESKRDFGRIDDDTILYCILARRGRNIARNPRPEFDDDNKASEFPGESREDAYSAGAEAIDLAVEFLQQDAGVPHFALLPYRNLLVVLARFFAHFPEADIRERLLLRRWFWRAAMVGPYIFKGSATGAMRTLAGKITPGDLSGSLAALLAAVQTDVRQPPNVTRLRTNEGAGRIILCAWWNLTPKLWNAELTEFDEITKERLASCLIDRATASFALETVLPNRYISVDRRPWAANRVLTAPQDDKESGTLDDLLRREPVRGKQAAWEDALTSHNLSPEIRDAYNSKDFKRFIEARQSLIDRNLRDFLDRMCEWEFEDTPSLDKLILDDEVSAMEEGRDDVLF